MESISVKFIEMIGLEKEIILHMQTMVHELVM